MSTRVGEGEVILEIRPPAFRRALSLAAMLLVAGLLAFVAATSADLVPVSRAAMIAVAAACLLLAHRFRRATSVALELTREELRDSDGRVLFRLDEIARLDRGLFALKPSTGLSVVLERPARPAWKPGLWWRLGRRVGIGGATAPSQAKAIVETLTLLRMEGEGEGGAGRP